MQAILNMRPASKRAPRKPAVRPASAHQWFEGVVTAVALAVPTRAAWPALADMPRVTIWPGVVGAFGVLAGWLQL